MVPGRYKVAKRIECLIVKSLYLLLGEINWLLLKRIKLISLFSVIFKLAGIEPTFLERKPNVLTVRR